MPVGPVSQYLFPTKAHILVLPVEKGEEVVVVIFRMTPCESEKVM